MTSNAAGLIEKMAPIHQRGNYIIIIQLKKFNHDPIDFNTKNISIFFCFKKKEKLPKI